MIAILILLAIASVTAAAVALERRSQPSPEELALQVGRKRTPSARERYAVDSTLRSALVPTLPLPSR